MARPRRSGLRHVSANPSASVTNLRGFRLGGYARPKSHVDLSPDEASADFRAACELAIEGVVALAEARIVASTRGDEAFEAWCSARIAETVAGLLGWWSLRVRTVLTLEHGRRRVTARIYGGSRRGIDYGSCSVGRLI